VNDPNGTPEVNSMSSGKTLITRAALLGFTAADAARKLGISRSYLSDVMNDRKNLSPESAALIADMIGDDATQAMKEQAVANEKNPERRSALKQALFQWLAVGVVLSAATPSDAKQIDASYRVAMNNIYIVAHWMRRWLARFGTGPSLSHC
jgi:transcriptional regulator with XRE-family HTH domain